MNQSSNTTTQGNKDKIEGVIRAAIACATVLGLWAIIGNTISLVIFLKTKSLRRRRSNYLLVNLCIADFLVGLNCLFHGIGFLRTLLSGRFRKGAFEVFLSSLELFSSFSSVNFLASVSLERLVAVAFPFYHRATGKTFYGLLIGTPWVVAVISTVTTSVGYLTSLIPLAIRRTLFVIYVSLPLLIMSAAYTVIMIRSRTSHINGNGARERLRDKKLAVTLLIVTLASLVTWLPSNYYLVIHRLYFSFYNLNIVYMALLFLQYSNSCINIVVYAWRIPEFKQVLFRHKPVVANVQGRAGEWNAGRRQRALAEPIEMHHMQRGEHNQIDVQLDENQA
ncbi:substance-K receptor-like [Nematostella vectensis]|uniref:substance-K receptor-like n=1 Tax=Nematostella vectensis TaxID=45351 RepID=UPI002076F1F6|nr:substance-K receptor-like [Nematostella vectensis]